MKVIIGNKVTSKIEKNSSIQKKIFAMLSQLNSYDQFNDAVIEMKLHLIQSPQLTYYSARVSFDYRLLLTYDGQENTCLIVDIVSHKDLEKKLKRP